MKEIRTIINAYDAIDKLSTQAALATVVRVEGSSYRRTGARMLVQDNGTWEGGISGGCLEGDALKKARLAILNDSPTLITYDTSQDDEHQIGVGLGCNGIIDVLFTPLDFSDDSNPVEILKKCVADNRKIHTLITLTNVKSTVTGVLAGEVILYESVHDLAGINQANIRQELGEHILRQQLKGTSAPVSLQNGQLSVFIELLPPSIHLVIMGHQYDVFPLSKLTHELGWETTVVAPVTKINRKIKAVVSAVESPESFGNVRIDEFTAIVLMSHDFEKDKRALVEVLKTNVPYIGMLGPRVRSERIWNELADEGMPVSKADEQRIYAPVGLDIGAVLPEEIALSLIAEIRAVFSGRNGASLRQREAPIHERM